jgi:GTP cyclohydrolase II
MRAHPGVRIPLPHGTLGTFVTFDGTQDFAVQFATPARQVAPLVRLHSECVTGDLFGSQRCDCGRQLEQALALLKAQGGTLLYLRQEGRGIGLAAKLDAYRLQELGMNTYDANLALGWPADARDYGGAAAMLRALGLERIRLLTNNPDKVAQLRRHGIRVAKVLPTDTFATPFNTAYLSAKAEHTGHTLRV